MNAGDAFGLTFHGRTRVEDGREVVVYSDGVYTHAVAAKHWDHCGFAACDEPEEQADNFAAWNRADDNWVDDLTAIEAAWRLDIGAIHSASGCGAMASDTLGACEAIARAHRGEHYESPAFQRDADRVNWDNLWPVIDRDGDLTGAVSDENDDFYSVGDYAMIEADEATAGGWTIRDGHATPPSPAPRSPRWISTAEQAEEFLATHKTVRLQYKRVRGGYVAVIHGTNVRPLPHGPMPKRKLERTLAHRYLAEVYDDSAHVLLRWARHLPNWASDLGALPELARAIEAAEREAARPQEAAS